uniref:Uncharacterized protein n=1 Tax=Palpitomonas bilix TaxID=652834 RepID=A0A7S3DCQ4_9EUKA
MLRFAFRTSAALLSPARMEGGLEQVVSEIRHQHEQRCAVFNRWKEFVRTGEDEGDDEKYNAFVSSLSRSFQAISLRMQECGKRASEAGAEVDGKSSEDERERTREKGEAIAKLVGKIQQLEKTRLGLFVAKEKLRRNTTDARLLLEEEEAQHGIASAVLAEMKVEEVARELGEVGESIDECMGEVMEVLEEQ